MSDPTSQVPQQHSEVTRFDSVEVFAFVVPIALALTALGAAFFGN